MPFGVRGQVRAGPAPKIPPKCVEAKCQLPRLSRHAGQEALGLGAPVRELRALQVASRGMEVVCDEAVQRFPARGRLLAAAAGLEGPRNLLRGGRQGHVHEFLRVWEEPAQLHGAQQLAVSKGQPEGRRPPPGARHPPASRPPTPKWGPQPLRHLLLTTWMDYARMD